MTDVSSSPPPEDEMDHTPPSSDGELDMNDMSAIESDDGRSSQPSLTSLVHDQDSNDSHESEGSRGSHHNDQSVSKSNEGAASSKPSPTRRRPRVLKSMSQLKGTPLGETLYDGHKLWTVPLTERVSVIEKATGKERHGSWAPLGRNLPRWLYSNPTWSIGDPSTCRKRKQAKRRSSTTMNSSDAGKQCSTPTKLSRPGSSTKKAKTPSTGATNTNNAASLANACKPSHILCAGLVQHQMLKGDVAIIDSMFQKAMKHSREGDFAAALDSFKTAKIIAASIKAKVSML